MVVPRSISCFLDISTLDNEDDNDEEDDKDCSDDDTPTAGPLQVLPSGWASFTSCVDDICCHYKSGCTNIDHDPSNDPLHHPTVFAVSVPDVSCHVYKLDIITGMDPYLSIFSI